MKKFIKVLLATLLIIVVVAAAIAFWQRDNIASFINGKKYSSEELASQIDSNRKELKTEVEKYTNSPINDLSAEDEEKLFKGEITIEDIAKKYNLPLDVMEEGSDQNSKNGIEIISSSNTDNSKAIDNAISDGVSKMYALKAKYVSMLGKLERSANDEYSKLPKEKQNESSKKEIISKNINCAANMEQKCDKEVDGLLSDLEKKLKTLNGDTGIIQVLGDSYKNEKELKKSYYLSLYNN